MGFVGIKGGVDSSEHHIGAAGACHGPNFVSAESIRGVDADTDDIAGLNLIGIDLRSGSHRPGRDRQSSPV